MWLDWTVVGFLQQASPALEHQVDYKDGLPSDMHIG